MPCDGNAMGGAGTTAAAQALRPRRCGPGAVQALCACSCSSSCGGARRPAAARRHSGRAACLLAMPLAAQGAQARTGAMPLAGMRGACGEGDRESGGVSGPTCAARCGCPCRRIAASLARGRARRRALG